MKKEFLQFFRNIPLLCIVLYACTLDIYTASLFSMSLKNYPIAIYDMDKSEMSGNLLDRIQQPYFIKQYYLNSDEEVDNLIESGEVGLVLIIPQNLEKNVLSGKGGAVQVILDATDGNTSQLASNYLSSILVKYNSELMVKVYRLPQYLARTTPLLTVDSRYEFNSTLTDAWTMCISEFFTIITLIAMLLPATAMVNEKQFGTIEQLMVAPVRPHEVMLAKVIPMMVIFIFTSFISVYCIMVPVVGIPFRGNVLEFLILTVVFCFATSGLGLLISTVSQNLSQTVLITMLVLFPIMFLSGAWAPVESLPGWMKYLITLSPLRYYLEIGTAIILKGNTLLFMWDQFLSLILLGSGIFWLGAVRFRKMFG